MNAENYLRRAQILKRRIHLKLREYSYIQDLATRITCTLYPEPGGSGISDRVGDAAVRMADLRREVEVLEAELAQASRSILDMLDRLPEKECTVLCADYTDVLRTRRPGMPERFGLVVLDPPYAKRLVCPALSLLLKGDWLEDDAFVVCESAEEDIFEGNEAMASHFEVRRRAKYGVAYVTVLSYHKEERHE